MSEPKFQVGELVAVCTYDISVVIPRTTILDRMLLSGGVIEAGEYKGQKGFSGWYYKIDATDFGYHESALRPYNEGDYTESTQEVHKVSGVPS